MDQDAAILPWFIYDDDDAIFPSTPTGVIRNHESDIKKYAAEKGVPPALLATVLLTELRHYNVFDTAADWTSYNHSVGIAQMGPGQILEHATNRPDLFPSGIASLQDAYEKLTTPRNAIELLASEIRYQADSANPRIDLSKWNSTDEQARKSWVSGFVSAKDLGYYYDGTDFGKVWGLQSYEMIKKMGTFSEAP